MKSRILKYALAGILAFLILFFAAVFIPFSRIDFPEKDYPQLVIENINIVDIKNDTVLQNQYLLMEGNLIKAIGSRPTWQKKAGQKSINGTGKYLVPALWDMHVHLTKQSPNSAYAQYLVNGIMHVRDMRGAYNARDHFASTPERIREWNKQVKELELLGPMVHGTTSFAVEGPSSMFDNLPEFFNCSNKEEAKELVNFFKEHKIDLIKTYNNIPREAFFTLMEEAKLAGIDVAGHKPVRVSTMEAANAGMRSMDHARFLIWDSFKGSQELRDSDNPMGRDNTHLRKQMLEEHDTTLLMANLKALKNNKTWYCPTHLTRKSDAFADDATFRARYDSINPIFRFISFEDLDAVIQEDPTESGRTVYKDFYKKGLEITKIANDEGVKILAGSDSPELPGSSLIDELQELSTAGLLNIDVLRAATINPAEYFQLDKEYGTVDVNKNADLILLSANPLAEISNLKKIDAIIYNGYYVNSGEIESMKEKITSRNNSVQMSAKLLWDILLNMTI